MPVPPSFPYVLVRPAAEDDVDLVAALLFEHGATGVEEQDRTTMNLPPEPGALRVVVGWFPDQGAADAAARGLGARFEVSPGTLVGDDWREGWRAWFEPRRVGRRLWVRPPWKAPPRVDPGDLVVTVDPGRAFGTGTHETTRLLLAALDARIRGGETVLDVGCGSGILGVAALLLGADRVLAQDVDPEAVAATRETADLNGVGDRLEATTTPPWAGDARHPVVLANIEAGVLLELADPLVAAVAPGGWLGLSGILAERADEVRAGILGAAERARVDLSPEPALEDGDWVALFFARGSG